MWAVVRLEIQSTSKTTRDCVTQRARSTQLLEAVQPVDSGLVVAAAGSFRPARDLKLSVGVTCHAHVLEIEGLFTQGSRTGRAVGE